nr:hypothetical protein [uncultured Draconibacterium sp.]
MKTKSSKFAFKTIALCAIFVMTIISCSKDDMSSTELNRELAEQISSDELFIEISKESKDFIETIKSKIKEKKLYGSNKIESEVSTEELNSILGLPDGYLQSNHESISQKSKLLFDKHNLTQKSENDVVEIFDELYALESSLHTIPKRLKSGSCEEEFAQRYNEIHEGYDSNVWRCLVAAAFGGSTTLVICNAMNVYNTYYQIAVAIDNYYECINQ